MPFMLQVHMSSSESSGLSDEHDPMAIVSYDEIAPIPEIFTSDSDSDPDPDLMSNDEDLDDFQPFALPDFGDDNIPLEDDVLALPLPIHDQIIIGHPMESMWLSPYLFMPSRLLLFPLSIGHSSST
ncbi:hypothetical protein Hanom_Chr11g01015821 [Helianthus anomalus]